ncbi:hypothetical protein BX616_008536, partial [Lobosporangium transversale]
FETSIAAKNYYMQIALAYGFALKTRSCSAKFIHLACAYGGKYRTNLITDGKDLIRQNVGSKLNDCPFFIHVTRQGESFKPNNICLYTTTRSVIFIPVLSLNEGLKKIISGFSIVIITASNPKRLSSYIRPNLGNLVMLQDRKDRGGFGSFPGAMQDLATNKWFYDVAYDENNTLSTLFVMSPEPKEIFEKYQSF